MIETTVLLQMVGGDCPEDIAVLNADPMLGKALGYDLPKATAAGESIGCCISARMSADLQKAALAVRDWKTFGDRT